MSLHDTLERFGQRAGDEVLELWRRWQAGDLTEPQFRALAEAILVKAGAKSTALADVALTAALTALTREAVAAVGLEPAQDAPGAAQAAVDDTLSSVSYQRDPEATVAVLGSAFAFEAFQKSYGEGMKTQGVTYWRRVADPGACEVCIDLSSGIISTDIPMWHHKGCRCVAQPID